MQHPINDGLQDLEHTDEVSEAAPFLASSEHATLPTTGKNMVRPVQIAAALAALACLGFAAMQLLPARHSAKPTTSNPQEVVSLSEDFCDSAWKEGIKAKDFASTALCQSVCPCCSGKPLPDLDCAADEDAPSDAGNKSLQQKWELDDALPRQLALIKSGAGFLTTMWNKLNRKYSFKEVLNHTLSTGGGSPPRSQVEQMVNMWTDMQTQKGWSDPEMAMMGYTAEFFYQPMNKILREAKSMTDIDDWWQSYIALLKDGLDNYAEYVDAPSYRGMTNCDGTLFHEGGKGLLPQFTSTTVDKQVALGWAKPCNGHDRLVLYFTGGGYDISKYSVFPEERELLLEPGREFVVGSVEKITCQSPALKKDVNYTVVHRLTHAPEKLKKSDDDSQSKPSYTCPKVKLESCKVCSCCSIPDSLMKE